MGASPELMQHLHGEQDAECQVWPENWVSVEVFCVLGTQWRIAAGMGGIAWIGLDYSAIIPVLRLMAIPRRDWPDLFNALRIMERAASAELNRPKG